MLAFFCIFALTCETGASPACTRFPNVLDLPVSFAKRVTIASESPVVHRLLNRWREADSSEKNRVENFRFKFKSTGEIVRQIRVPKLSAA